MIITWFLWIVIEYARVICQIIIAGKQLAVVK